MCSNTFGVNIDLKTPRKLTFLNQTCLIEKLLLPLHKHTYNRSSSNLKKISFCWPFVDFTEGSTPKALPEQTISTLFPFPKLKSTGNNPGDEHNGMLRLETFFLQLHAGRVGQRARDRLGNVLRKARGHGVVEEEEEPPREAHAPDEPAARIHARPLRLPSARFLVVFRFVLGVVVIRELLRRWRWFLRRRWLFPLKKGHDGHVMFKPRQGHGTFVSSISNPFVFCRIRD